MERNAQALEVYYRDKLVGWLDDLDGKSLERLGTIRLSMTIHPWTEEGFDSGSVVDERVFYLDTKKWSYGRFWTVDNPEAFCAKKHSIPKYAVESANPESDVVEYTWKAVKIDFFESYEWIFDYPHFIPANDNTTDLEAKKREELEAERLLVAAIGRTKDFYDPSSWTSRAVGFSTKSPSLIIYDGVSS